MEFDFLSPVETNLIIEIKRLSSQHLSNKVVFHTQEDFPDISKITQQLNWSPILSLNEIISNVVTDYAR